MKTKMSLLALSVVVTLAGCSTCRDEGMGGTDGHHKMMRDSGDINMDKNMGKPMDMNKGMNTDTRGDADMRMKSGSSSGVTAP